jgi:hypothetical protein
MKEIVRRQNSAAIFRQVSPPSLLDVSVLVIDSSGGRVRNDYKPDVDAQ